MKREPGVDRAAWVLLVVFVFTVPFEKTFFISGFGTASRLLGILTFLLAGFAFATGRSLRPPNLLLALSAAFASWMALTWLWSIAPDTTWTRAATYAQLFVMMWLVWEFARTQYRQTALMSAYVAGAAVSSVATIVRFAQNEQTYYRRYAAYGFDPNDLALTVALSIPLALYVSHRSRGFARWALWGTVALAEAAVLLTGSRTSLVASFVAFTFVALRWRSTAPIERAAGVALAGLLLIGLVRLAPAASRERLANFQAQAGTLHGRTRIWKAGLKAWKQHPIAGVGAGAYPFAVKPWLGVPPIPGHEYVAHNTFLSVLVEGGVAGLALFGAMLAATVVFTWMMAPRDRALWFVMLAVWFTGVATLTWEHRKPTWLILALIATAWARAFREET